MEIEYRQSFLKDLKNLRGTEVYARVYELTFTELPDIEALQDVLNVKALKGYPGRYRIRIGDYRIGIEVVGDAIEIIRIGKGRSSFPKLLPPNNRSPLPLGVEYTPRPRSPSAVKQYPYYISNISAIFIPPDRPHCLKHLL